MAGSGNPAPRQPRPPAQRPAAAAAPPRRPPQVMLIRKEGPGDKDEQGSAAPQPPASNAPAAPPARPAAAAGPRPAAAAAAPASVVPSAAAPAANDDDRFDLSELEGLTMADLLGPEPSRGGSGKGAGSPAPQAAATSDASRAESSRAAAAPRSVDDFDFDEEAFLAALDQNEPVGTTGEVLTGTVVGVESDGVYVDIGGKAPGFMPKKEAGLGVMTNLKERFPRGLAVQVLVTREQNADGMVTVSARALALRQSWEKVRQLEKEGKVVQVLINGFNRGGVTCDLEGLRGFIPRSQLQEGENHEALVGRTIGVTFLEVNPETRKLVLSERRASTAARFAELEVGQLVEGQVAALKPYGFFIDLGGISGLLHHSAISGAVLRDLREVFQPGERVKALITELDPGRGRIALNTALLEGQPGELLIAKETVMNEAVDRANRARSVLRQQEQSAG
jgi:small subunit ribosomal protein S1